MNCPICDQRLQKLDDENDNDEILILRCKEYFEHNYCHYFISKFSEDQYEKIILFYKGYTIHNNEKSDFCKVFLYSELKEHIFIAKPTFQFKYVTNFNSYLKLNKEQFINKLQILDMLK